MDYKDRAAAWLADPAIDEATKEEIRGLEADPKELEDRFYRDLDLSEDSGSADGAGGGVLRPAPDGQVGSRPGQGAAH